MRKIFLRALLGFFLVYLLLFLLFSLPGTQKAMGTFYTTLANRTVPGLLPQAYLVFEQDPTRVNDPNRIRVRLQSQALVAARMQEAREAGVKTIDLNFKTYQIFLFEFFIFPLLFFSALVVATPVHWKRKPAAWALGLVLLLLYLGSKTFFITLYHLQNKGISGYQMSPFHAQILEKVQLVFNNLGTALIVAILLWAVTIFKKDDWKTLVARFGGKEVAP